MTPVDQTKFGDEGNCFAACIASLLELAIDAVPDFNQSDHWVAAAQRWLAPYGFGLMVIEPDSTSAGCACIGHLKRSGAYYIAGGKAARGLDHAVIYRKGELVHDPHPDKSGIVSVDDYTVLFPLDPARLTTKD